MRSQCKNTGCTMIYKKGKKVPKKKVSTVAIVLLGTVATVQNLKKKKGQSG